MALNEKWSAYQQRLKNLKGFRIRETVFPSVSYRQLFINIKKTKEMLRERNNYLSIQD